jgi:hypothetical protein
MEAIQSRDKKAHQHHTDTQNKYRKRSFQKKFGFSLRHCNVVATKIRTERD